MTRTWIALVAALALTLSGAARAQETFDSLGGTWWFRIGGQDKGALLIEFTVPDNGLFAVKDIERTGKPSFGFSSTLGAFFVVAEGQPLTFDSHGSIIGTLDLTAPDDPNTVLGTLTFEKGKPNKKFTGWKSRASLVADGGLPVVAKLTGKRIPLDFPVLSGGNPETTVSGKGVKSKAFDLHVRSDSDGLGLPAYIFDGAGPVLIDKVETPDTSMDGRFMLSPKYELFGLLEDSPEFGTGQVSGKLKLPSESLIPKLNLVARVDRKVTAKGRLTEPVEPILSVTPTTFDFGALHLDDPNVLHGFLVSNVGIGALSGEAHFLSGSSTDFTFIDDAETVPYGPLYDPNNPTDEVVVRFNPSSAGTKTAQILFSVDSGAGAKIVTVTGTGGIAAISVDPTSIDFADTTVGDFTLQTVTVTNTGDGILTGEAKVTGTDFALLPLGQPNPVVGISYTLNPGGNKQFTVRFKPAATGDKAGTLTLTGGGGDTVPLTGTGI